MNYYDADKIKKKGHISLLTDKIISGGGIMSSVRSTISDKAKARLTSFKKNFDIMNIAKVLTGGSNLAPALVGKLLGRSKEDMRYFTGKKQYTNQRRESTYFNNYSTRSQGSKKATLALEKILSFMETSREKELQERDTSDSFKELNQKRSQDRHKEVVDVFIEATKVKRKAEKDMAKEAKKREQAAKKAEKENSKDTGGKGAVNAADTAKKAKDAADTAKKAKDAADTAKKAKDTADTAKKAKDAADSAKKAKDTADSKKAADTAKKQESVPKNKSAEKVKETKSEAPSATPATPAIEAAKTAAKVGAGTIVAGLSAVGVTNAYAQAAVLANVKKESDFKLTSENLNYTTLERLRKVFPSKTKSKTDDELKQYLKNPEGLAEFVYGGKMKNDNPGDGFKYRGRGSIQLTGKENYEYYGKLLKVDLVKDPDLVLNPEINAKIVALYTKQTLGKKVNEFKTQEEANRAVTQAIGGSKLNLDKGIGAELLQKVNKASLDYSPEKLQNLSTENADMKKDMSQGSSAGGPVIIQNNNTTQAKTNIQRTAPQEQLNPTMR